MQNIVISLLGLSVYPTKSNYQNNSSYDLQTGDFINSIDVLLNSFDDKFIFFGTQESIKKHRDTFKDLIAEKEDVNFIEYDSQNLNDIFQKIISTIIENGDKDILFDITHSFRDSVIMSVISTIISQIVYNPNITMIYAKEEKKEKEKKYVYELVGDDILNTSNIAFILSSFVSTLRIPQLNSKYKLFEILNDFSIHLLSNQFKDIYEKDIISLESYVKENREKLFFVKDLLKKLEDIITNIKNIQDKDTYKQFLFFSEFFHCKDYYLHSVTYLIEAINYYIGLILTELKMINFDYNEYKNQTKIVSFLRLNPPKEDFNFPNEYFIDINVHIIDKFYNLREEVAKIRHNLAHININQDYGEIKEKLQNLIDEFSTLVENRILYNFDETEKNKTLTVKYNLEEYEKELKKLTLNNQNPAKLQTTLKKYENNSLNDLTMFNQNKLQSFMDNNHNNISILFQHKEKRELLLKEKDINEVVKNRQENNASSKTNKSKGFRIVKKGKENL
jgi:hypothetical protein